MTVQEIIDMLEELPEEDKKLTLTAADDVQLHLEGYLYDVVDGEKCIVLF